MADVIEGKRAVLEALSSSIPIESILIARGVKGDALVDEIVGKAEKRRIAIRFEERSKIDRICASSRIDKGKGPDASRRGKGQHANSNGRPDARKDANQGVIALAAPFRYAPFEQLLESACADSGQGNGRSLIVVLDHITDTGNFGAIARSAESVGAAGIVIASKRSVQVTGSTYKSSAGAVLHLPISKVANISQAIEQLKESGFWAVGLTEHADELVWEADLKGRICMVMGSEDKGISRLVQEKCDTLAKLPQLGKLSSLNVAQAFTACAYEWVRQNMTQQS